MIGQRICLAVVFAVEAMIAWLYFDTLFGKKRSARSVVALISLGYLLLYAISIIDSAALNTISFFFVHFFLLKICYVCKTSSAVLHSAFLCFVMSITELLMALLISTFTDNYTAFKNNLVVMIALAVSSKLLYLFIVITLAQVIKPSDVKADDPSFLVLLCVMPVASTIIALCIVYIGLTVELTNIIEIFITVSALLLLILNIIVLIVYRHVQEMNTEYTALQLSSLREQTDVEYYDMLQKQYESQRILIHDIKNHLGVLDNMAHENDMTGISAYIANLYNLPAFARHSRLCSNPVLNIILLRYADICAEKKVRFDCDVRADCVSFIDDVSLTSLFGNLLSNAVEAAEISHDKFIELLVKQAEYDVTIISIINSCDTPPLKDKSGNFKSRKLHSERHGLGTKSIRRITQKYGGTLKMYYLDNEKRFHSIIYFNNPQKE